MKQDLPDTRVKSGEDKQFVCAEFTTMVERISKLEVQAIAQLEAALTTANK